MVAQSNSRTLYGARNVGTYTGWHDAFAINMKDLEYDDLMLHVYKDDHEYGRTNLSLNEITSSALPSRSSMRGNIV